jgi:hypothetical protein
MLTVADSFLKSANSGVAALKAISPYAPMPSDLAPELSPLPWLSKEEVDRLKETAAEQRAVQEAKEAEQLDPRKLSERYAEMRTHLEACRSQLGAVSLLFHPKTRTVTGAEQVVAGLAYGATMAQRFREYAPSSSLSHEKIVEELGWITDQFDYGLSSAEYGLKTFVEGAWERLARPLKWRPNWRDRLGVRWVALKRRVSR